MQAILLCSGRIVEIEMIPDDPDHVVVFATVYRRVLKKIRDGIAAYGGWEKFLADHHTECEREI